MPSSDPLHRRPSATLPDDLLEIVCVQAAQQDRYAAYALALTSHKTCRWTAKARWQTVVIRSVRQLLSFWRALYAVPDEIVEAFAFHLQQQHECTFAETQSMLLRQSSHANLGPAHNRLTRGLSYPSDGKPHRHVRHLFIDISADTQYVSEQAHSTTTALKRTGLLFMSTSLFGRSDCLADPSRLLSRWTCRDRSMIEHLSLGVDESESIDWGSLQGLQLDELTLVLRKDYSGDLHVDMPPSVRRLHLVGQDPKSELTGVEPPWMLLRCLTSPILNVGLTAVPTLSHRRLTHIRYDTRRFSLKPAEITAKRLRHLLQECTVAPSLAHLDIAEGGSGRELAAAFQFNGPRHAAPARGAGSYTVQQRHSRLTPVHHLAAQYGEQEPVACFLDKIGVGQLDQLHFAWEPMGRADTSPPWYRRKDGEQAAATTVLSPSAETAAAIDQGMQSDSGGWPTEKRGAWAERSERRSALAAFAYELRDAINTLYGWQPSPPISATGRPNVAFSPEGSGMMIEPAQAGISQQDEEELRSMAVLVKAHVPDWRRNHAAEWDEEDADFLRFGIRAPQSLLRLGGQAAFTSDDRLALFERRARGGEGAWHR